MEFGKDSNLLFLVYLKYERKGYQELVLFKSLCVSVHVCVCVCVRVRPHARMQTWVNVCARMHWV